MSTGGHTLNLFCVSLFCMELLINILIDNYRRQPLILLLMSRGLNLLTLLNITLPPSPALDCLNDATTGGCLGGGVNHPWIMVHCLCYTLLSGFTRNVFIHLKKLSLSLLLSHTHTQTLLTGYRRGPWAQEHQHSLIPNTRLHQLLF